MSLWQVPAVVLAVLMWLFTPPASLGEAARREALRRQLMPRATRSLSNQEVSEMPGRPVPTALPASTDAPPTTAATTGADPSKVEAARPEGTAHDEVWWRERVAGARQTLDRDQLMADSLQSRVNALTNDASARDDPAQRQQLYELRARTIAELERTKEQVVADRRAIEAMEEEARTQNVPAGWIR